MSLRRTTIAAVGFSLSAALAALDGCGDTVPDAMSGSDASVEAGADARSAQPPVVGSSCGAPESKECGGDGLGPPSNPRAGCTADAGLCITIENPDAGPLAAVGGGCAAESECAGDFYGCAASNDCAPSQRCCAHFNGPHLLAVCAEDCGSGVELCDFDAGCTTGACQQYTCSTTIPGLLACGQLAGCR